MSGKLNKASSSASVPVLRDGPELSHDSVHLLGAMAGVVLDEGRLSLSRKARWIGATAVGMVDHALECLQLLVVLSDESETAKKRTSRAGRPPQLRREIGSWFVGLLRRQTRDHEHCFGPMEIADFLAAFMVENGYTFQDLTSPAYQLMARFARRAGVSQEDTDEEALDKLETHFAESPLNPELVLAFEQELRELVSVLGAKWARDCLQDSRGNERPETRPAPPPGAVRVSFAPVASCSKPKRRDVPKVVGGAKGVAGKKRR
jgi:hypothetical protein